MMTHDEIRELVAIVALDAADERETREVATHVVTCVECATELVSLRSTGAELAATVTPIAPSPEVRERILAAGASGAAASDRAPSRRRDSGRREPSAPPRRMLSRVAAIAAALALGVLFWSDLSLRRQRVDLDRELTVARLRAETAERDLAEARKKADFALAALVRERAAVSLLSDPRTTNVAMAGTAEAPQARARIAVHSEAEQAVLFCAGMPAPPPGQAYELWFIDGEEKIPGGVFSPAPDGTCLYPARIPPEGRRANVFAVTLEPAGGVTAPTGQIYLVGSTK